MVRHQPYLLLFCLNKEVGWNLSGCTMVKQSGDLKDMWKIRMTANEIFSLKQDSPSFCRTQMSLVQLSTVGEADFTWRIKRAKEPNQPMRFSRCMTKDCNQPCTSYERRWKLPDMLQETAQSINKSDDDRNLSTLPLAGTTSISCRCHYALEQWELYHGHDNWQSNNLDWIKQGTWNPLCNIWFFNLVARIKTNTKDTLLLSCSSNLNVKDRVGFSRCENIDRCTRKQSSSMQAKYQLSAEIDFKLLPY